jgi:hypothetical protein
VKFDGSVSLSGLQRCYWSTGSQVGGGGGGRRRRVGAAAELRQGVALGKKEDCDSQVPVIKAYYLLV